MAEPNPVIETIKSRRSIRQMRADLIPSRQQVETIIEAATWAPNHHMTEPWRFIVYAGGERRGLGEALAAALIQTYPDTPREKLEMERNKPLTAPVILTIISSSRIGPKVLEQEELVAAGAALQNVLLSAHALGLSTMVRTGAHAYSESMRHFFGLTEGEVLVGMVYLGYASEIQPLGKRTDPRSKTVWHGM